MPQIIVIADMPSDGEQPPVLFRERVNVSDFDSQHFAAQLVERLGWAVGDADEVNRRVRGSRNRHVDNKRADTVERELALSGSAPPAFS